MSGTTTTSLTAEAGLFRNYTVTPASVTDLQTAITSAIATAAAAAASAASAEADAVSATSAATAAQNASTAAIAAVNSAASTAETSINASVATVNTAVTQAQSSASAAATSATNAANSATSAASSGATYAGQASTSATNAANSATAAANSATTAASSSSSASTSSSNAASSATAAAGSATNAQTSATNAAGSATAAASSATTASSAVTTALNQGLGNFGRNYVQNSRFQIQQRGGGPWNANGLTADRWTLGLSGNSVTTTIAALSDGNRASIGDEAARYCLLSNVSGNALVGSFAQVSQSIEDVTRLSGKTITVSFWANASAALNMGVYLTQYFGTGGSPSAFVNVAPQVAAVGTNFSRFSLTFTLPSTAGKTLGTNGDHSTKLAFGFSSGATYAAQLGVGVQTGVFNIYGVQLEVGSTATPLEVKNLDYDLLECSRFYQTGTVKSRCPYGYPVGYGWYDNVPLPIQMRTTPTASVTALTSAGATSSAFTPIGPQTLEISASVSGSVSDGTHTYVQANYAASADL